MSLLLTEVIWLLLSVPILVQSLFWFRNVIPTLENVSCELWADTHNMHAETNVDNGEVVSQSGFMTMPNLGPGQKNECYLCGLMLFSAQPHAHDECK